MNHRHSIIRNLRPSATGVAAAAALYGNPVPMLRLQAAQRRSERPSALREGGA